jgi:hypothetical protein
VVFNWDTVDPETVLSDIYQFIKEAGIKTVKIKVVRPATFNGNKFLVFHMRHTFIIITPRSNLYNRDLIRRIFNDYVVHRREGKIVLMSKDTVDELTKELE